MEELKRYIGIAAKNIIKFQKDRQRQKDRIMVGLQISFQYSKFDQ
jgi:hypothetical protein